MIAAYLGFAITVLVVAIRPSGLGPALGALAGVLVAAAGGAIVGDDLTRAGETLWRPFLTLLSIMAITAAAEEVGLVARIAAMIEPRTRGPVKRAFRVTFALSALLASVLSNDAAVLLLTPIVLTLLRTVYPRRHPKFLVPFAFAVFAAAGVAPLVISNPMNLVVAGHAGIGFNRYALVMAPIALAGWFVTYALLAWFFREPLADQAPALGAWPGPTDLDARGKLVLAVVTSALVTYPIVSYLDGPLWMVALTGAAVATAAARPSPRALSWGVFPFLAGVFLLAIGLERAGLVDHLRSFYAGDAPIARIGATSALGSALLDNHPMSILNLLALEHAPHQHVLAALIGGDLGPRLLPMGSLAGLLWFDSLRRHDVVVSVRSFVTVGVLVTIPSLAISLAILYGQGP